MKDWIDKVNSEDHYNVAAAIEAGLAVPEVRFLRTMTMDEQQEALNDPGWIALPSGMLIERIYGPECTFHAYRRDDMINCQVISVVDGELLTGGQGPNVGDNCMTLFSGRSPLIDDVIVKLLEQSDRHQDYTGFINVSVVWRDATPYYQRIEYGYTNKFLITLMDLYDSNLRIFFNPEMDYVRDKYVKGFGASLRVWGWPFTDEANYGIGDPGGVWDGRSWVVSSRGDNIKGAWASLYSKISHGCYRTDGSTTARRVFNELMRGGYIEKYEMDFNNDSDNVVNVRGGVPDQALHDETGHKDSQENGSEIQDRVS